MGKDWDKLDGGLPQQAVWRGRRGKGGSNIGDDDTTAAARHHVSFGVKRAGFKRCVSCGKRAFSGSPCRCDTPSWVIEYPKGPPSSAIRMQRWHDQWALSAYEVLKPGGYLLAFGGSRTHHRLWCAIEDAGFVIQDTIMWLNGQGFPKGRTQLKPAFEPICVAYKPGGKRELQIDECRIETDWNSDPTRRGWQGGKTDKTFLPGQGAHRPVIGDKPFDGSRGRWPANICHDGSDEVMEAFAAFGEKTSGKMKAGTERSARCARSVCYGQMPKVAALQDFCGDTGSVGRFYYCAKASKADRAGSKHPTVKPIALMRWLVRLVTPPGGTVLDPFAGSGTTGAAAIAEGRNAILIEREPEYIGDIRRRLKPHKAAA